MADTTITATVGLSSALAAVADGAGLRALIPGAAGRRWISVGGPRSWTAANGERLVRGAAMKRVEWGMVSDVVEDHTGDLKTEIATDLMLAMAWLENPRTAVSLRVMVWADMVLPVRGAVLPWPQQDGTTREMLVTSVRENWRAEGLASAEVTGMIWDAEGLALRV